MNKDFFCYSDFDINELPEFGYKIHISSTIDNYKFILDLVLPYLDNKKIAYKYIYKEEYILSNYSKNENAAESGKLITIYPKNTEDFKILIEELYKIIPKNLDGIYILSDRSYKDSNIIFYRFGTIKTNIKNTTKGFPTLIGPNGEIWRDYQKTFFDLPSWIQDIQKPQIFGESYLYYKYNVIKVLKYSNGGNVYFAINKTDGKKVVIKESRANILAYEKYKHRIERDNEYFLISSLDKFISHPIEKVDEWINRYYIYEFIDGESLYYQLTKHSIFNFEHNNIKHNIRNFKKYLSIINKIINLIKYFHSKNVVLNDVHTDNFINNEDNIYFIDLGNSYKYGEKPDYGIYNEICLKEWNNIDGKISDIKKLCNLILFTIAKLQIRNENELEDNLNLLSELLSVYGITTNISSILKDMMESENMSEVMKIFNNITIIENIDAIRIDMSNKVSNRIYFNPDNYIDNLEYQSFSVEYKNENFEKIKYYIDKENKLGLFGLSGFLLNLVNSKDKINNDELVYYGINSIIEKLIFVDGNRIVPIRSYAGSPYIDTGSSGFIKLLINFDSEKYRDIILELAENIITNFAQRAGYYDGMLGIADTLISVYTINNDNKYLKSIESLLLNSLFYLKYNKITKNEFFYVYKRFQKLIEGKL